MTTRSMIASVVLGLASVTVVAGCGSSSDGAVEGTTTTTAATTMTTPIPGGTYPPATPPTGSTQGTGSTVSNGSVPPTTVALVPGQPCTPGSSPDCISPENDGQYVYLIGGAACMASPIAGPLCSDLDGDGHAGYPDAG